MKNRLHFRTNVQLKSIIGKDLINNDNIAVLELVKNSYDAGSNEVEVIFKNLKKNDDETIPSYSGQSSKIFINDWGSGMDEEDITEKWLNIAYSEKKIEPVKNGRVMAGAKGVGRFSCDRLGKYLDLYTRKKGHPIYHLFIDWSKFEVDDKKDFQIQDVEVILEEIPGQEFKDKFGKDLEHGTILEISKLRGQWAIQEKNKWDTRKILDLRRYLEKLINPNQVFESKRFIINLIAPDFKEEDALHKAPKRVNGIIENKIFEKLNFTTTVIESSISPDGKTITTNVTDKGVKAVEVIEKNVGYSLLKDIKIVLFYLNPYAKAYFKRQTGIRSIQFGSIFLFINGFRVNPLGDAGDDWLRIEVRKGQGHSKFLGTREVIGRIEINDPQRLFQIISSREGIVKDRRYEQIAHIYESPYKGFFYKTLRRLEKFVVEGLDWDRTTESGKKIEKDVGASNWKYEPNTEKYQLSQKEKNERVLGMIRSFALLETRLENILSVHVNENLIIQLLSEKRERAKDKFNKFFGKNELFAKDILDEVTWDTINSVREELQRSKKEIEKRDQAIAKKKQEISDLKKEKKEIEEKLELEKGKSRSLEIESESQKEQIYFLKGHVEASKGYDALLHLYHHVTITVQSIDKHIRNLRKKVSKNKVGNDTLMEFLEEISILNSTMKAISTAATKANVNFSTESLELTSENLTAFIVQYIENRVRLYRKGGMNLRLDKKGIFADFYHNFNSIATIILIDNLINNSEKANAKNLVIEIISYENELILDFIDDGKGVPKENEEKIFDFGFSTTNGTGLGLFHAKKIVNELGGEIRIINEIPNGCHIKIEVKR